MHRQSSKELEKQLADSFHLPITTIRLIVQSQFRFVADVIHESATHLDSMPKNVLLRNFGRFVVTRYKKSNRECYAHKLVGPDEEIVFIDDTVNDNGLINGKQQ